MNLESEIIGIAIDGVGYGDDNTIWGGEILHCDYIKYKRLACLKQQPMIGGDLASYYPKKMLFGILSTIKKDTILDIINKKLINLDLYNDEKNIAEQKIIFDQVTKNTNIIKTSSMGRVLDSIAALFSICDERTYEGEPAMKLESYLELNKHCIKNSIKVNTDGWYYKKDSKEIFDTSLLFEKLIELISDKNNKCIEIVKLSNDILINSISKLAINASIDTGINTVGITGGVANNDYIVASISKILQKEKINVINHRQIPSGDGGISVGQVAHAAAKLILSRK